MYRASTNDQSIILSFDPEQLLRLEVVYKQGGKIILTKTLDDMTPDPDNPRILRWRLTQAESNLFEAGEALVQARYLAESMGPVDTCRPSPVMRVYVSDVLNDEVMAWADA